MFMSESFIPASEFETASNAVKNILGQPVEEIEITDILPPLNDIADSNKVFKGKLAGCVCWITVLFARVNPNEFSNRGIKTMILMVFAHMSPQRLERTKAMKSANLKYNGKGCGNLPTAFSKYLIAVNSLT